MEPCQVSREFVDALLRFDRYYERRLAAEVAAVEVHEFTWTQWQVLRAVGEYPSGRTVGWLRQELKLDSGYVARIIRGFTDFGFVSTGTSDIDARSRVVELTDRGRRCYRGMQESCEDQARRALLGLTHGEQKRLAQAMRTVEDLLHPEYFLLKHWRRQSRY
jgi:DNA-binding MarR family transcriptional regulator